MGNAMPTLICRTKVTADVAYLPLHHALNPDDDIPAMIEASDLSVYGCDIARAWHMTLHTSAVYTVRQFMDPDRSYWRLRSHELMHNAIWGGDR